MRPLPHARCVDAGASRLYEIVAERVPTSSRDQALRGGWAWIVLVHHPHIDSKLGSATRLKRPGWDAGICHETDGPLWGIQIQPHELSRRRLQSRLPRALRRVWGWVSLLTLEQVAGVWCLPGLDSTPR